MLYLIGLGLGDAKDITVRGLEVVKSAKQVYLEAYTSVLTVGKEALVNIFFILFYSTNNDGFTHSVIESFLQEEYYGREVIVADREFVEQKSEEMIESAVVDDIAFLGLSY